MPPVEIQWCDHSSVLLDYLRQLYEEGRFVDVGLECEGRQVKAHKAVISACSPYLEGLLKGNPARSHLIKFNGYSYNSLHAVIDFMYNGSVLVEQENLAAFLKLGRALQVRGILDIAAQCEEAGLTTAEETKSNAQYSTTVQQSQKQQQSSTAAVQSKQPQTETKKYAFMVDKPQTPKKTGPNQQQNVLRKPDTAAKPQPQQQPVQVQQQQIQQQQIQQEQQLQQEQQVQQQGQLQTADGSDVEQSTLEELQQALASGQALIQTDGTSGDQTLQMMEGQCVVTGSGQTYVVVQEGDNISFVPAEMVQGDLQAAVNGGQVMEELDPVEQQLAQMEGTGDNTVTSAQNTQQTSVLTTTTAQEQLVSSTEGGESAATSVASSLATPSTTSGGDTMETTMSVVESLVKLGEKQPQGDKEKEETVSTEVGADMPSLDNTKGEGEEEVGGEEEEEKVGGEKRPLEEDPDDPQEEESDVENVSKKMKNA